MYNSNNTTNNTRKHFCDCRTHPFCLPFSPLSTPPLPFPPFAPILKDLDQQQPACLEHRVHGRFGGVHGGVEIHRRLLVLRGQCLHHRRQSKMLPPRPRAVFVTDRCLHTDVGRRLHGRYLHGQVSLLFQYFTVFYSIFHLCTNTFVLFK